MTTSDFDLATPRPPVPAGRPGEFDFLEGEWRIANRRLPPGATVWDEFEGAAECHTILGGAGSVEDLRIPARNFAGLGLRLLDRSRSVWVDNFINARFGVVSLPGTDGGFANGVGVFEAEDLDGAVPIRIRGVWDQIERRSCRWRQAVSRDAGRTWAENWIMHWTRA